MFMITWFHFFSLCWILWPWRKIYSTWFWQNVLVLSHFAPFICNTDVWFLGAVTLGQRLCKPLRVCHLWSGWKWLVSLRPIAKSLSYNAWLGPGSPEWLMRISDSKDWLLTTYKDDKRLFNHHLSTISPHVFYIYIYMCIYPHMSYTWNSPHGSYLLRKWDSSMIKGVKWISIFSDSLWIHRVWNVDNL